MKEKINKIKVQLSKNGIFVSNLITYGLLLKNLKSHFKLVKSNKIGETIEKDSPYLSLKTLLLEHPEYTSFLKGKKLSGYLKSEYGFVKSSNEENIYFNIYKLLDNKKNSKKKI